MQKVQKKKKKKNCPKSFFLLDNCIGIGCVQLSLLRREYFSSAVSESTNSPKILHITKIDFSEFNFLRTD